MTRLRKVFPPSRAAALTLLSLLVVVGCSDHTTPDAGPENACEELFDLYTGCGYDTNIPGLPEQQERLLRIEAGECDDELICYAECMLAVHRDQDDCWRCELTDTECRDSPSADCPPACGG